MAKQKQQYESKGNHMKTLFIAALFLTSSAFATGELGGQEVNTDASAGGSVAGEPADVQAADSSNAINGGSQAPTQYDIIPCYTVATCNPYDTVNGQ